MYLSRGVRQSSYDLWRTRRKPVMIRGDWKHPSAPTEHKRYWLPDETIPATPTQRDLLLSAFGVLPSPGQCVRVRGR